MAKVYFANLSQAEKDRYKFKADAQNARNPGLNMSAEDYYYSVHPENAPASLKTKTWEQLSQKDKNYFNTKGSVRGMTGEEYYYTLHPEAKPKVRKQVKQQTPPETKTADTKVTKVKNSKTQQDTKLEPIPNPLLGFNSSTYSVSLYIQTPEQYNNMVRTGAKTVKGMQLLMQSGGISADKNDNFGAIRNKNFPEDFYMDNIQFKSHISGTAVGAAHNSYEINFTVTEPMGLTFLDRLDKAVTEFNSDNKNFNKFTQFYVMVIRFYGYDENGKPQTLDQLNKSKQTTSDPKATSEKWIPFMIKNVNFKLSAEQVVYNIEAIPSVTHAGNDKIHGVIPFNVGLQGQKLGDLLSGTEAQKVKRDLRTDKQKQAQTEAKTDPPPPNTIVLKGLATALNDWQKEEVNCGRQEYADEYVFDIDDPDFDLSSIKLAHNKTPLFNRTGMVNGRDTASNFKAATGNTSHTINNVKTFALNSGMKIMQALDLMMRTSNYITDQFDFEIEENADGVQGVTKKYTVKKDNEPLKWFKITRSTEVQDGKYDCARDMWALKITYYIRTYEIQSIDTPTYKGTNYFVPHKEYQYWFTGKNTDVLNFEQEYNALYYASFGTKQPPTDDNQNPTGNHNLRQMKAYKVNSMQDSQGGKEGRGADAAANLASTLYSPADQARIYLDIVGDPDWIGQSELFYSAKALGDDFKRRSMPDRSVNYDTAEVFFALTFNTVVDYDIETGLADVTKKNYNRSPGATKGGVAAQSFLYRANLITTQLTQGEFKQQLEGSLQPIPDEYITGKGKPPKYEKKVLTETTDKRTEAQKKKAKKKTPSTDKTQATPGPKCQREDLKKKCKKKPHPATSSRKTTDKTGSES